MKVSKMIIKFLEKDKSTPRNLRWSDPHDAIASYGYKYFKTKRYYSEFGTIDVIEKTNDIRVRIFRKKEYFESFPDLTTAKKFVEKKDVIFKNFKGRIHQ